MTRIQAVAGCPEDSYEPSTARVSCAHVRKLLNLLPPQEADQKQLPRAADVRDGYRPDQPPFAPVLDHRPLNTSSVHACLSIVEYFATISSPHRISEPIRLSHRFAYKMARVLALKSGDCGASLREVLEAIARFGVPPERFWPDSVEQFDDHPEASSFVLAQSLAETVHFRPIEREMDREHALAQLKRYIVAGIPVAFVTALPRVVGEDGLFEFHEPFDEADGHPKHALVAVGYDDHCRRTGCGVVTVRNCWGSAWGEAGYGRLPYEYITRGIATDFWTVLRTSWIGHRGWIPNRLIHHPLRFRSAP